MGNGNQSTTAKESEEVLSVWANASDESQRLLSDLRKSGLRLKELYAVEQTPLASFRGVLYYGDADIRSAFLR